MSWIRISLILVQGSIEFFWSTSKLSNFSKNILYLFHQWTSTTTTTKKPCSKDCTENRKTVCLYQEDVPQCFADCLKKVRQFIFAILNQWISFVLQTVKNSMSAFEVAVTSYRISSNKTPGYCFFFSFLFKGHST